MRPDEDNDRDFIDDEDNITLSDVVTGVALVMGLLFLLYTALRYFLT